MFEENIDDESVPTFAPAPHPATSLSAGETLANVMERQEAERLRLDAIQRSLRGIPELDDAKAEHARAVKARDLAKNLVDEALSTLKDAKAKATEAELAVETSEYALRELRRERDEAIEAERAAHLRGEDPDIDVMRLTDVERIASAERRIETLAEVSKAGDVDVQTARAELKNAENIFAHAKWQVAIADVPLAMAELLPEVVARISTAFDAAADAGQGANPDIEDAARRLRRERERFGFAVQNLLPVDAARTLGSSPPAAPRKASTSVMRQPTRMIVAPNCIYGGKREGETVIVEADEASLQNRVDAFGHRIGALMSPADFDAYIRNAAEKKFVRTKPKHSPALDMINRTLDALFYRTKPQSNEGDE